ncbi:MAG: UDP-N-acetylmuramoyl-L-alanyl-D-glutamate--2,6-diaminopimelate ligase [Acidobacteria bacterium]|nr:UDP-N-acetylmuramoyl-L-alanyl-D-glutamate--2,6-diaminopimelate ligase [Acidobacteriota bacterium]
MSLTAQQLATELDAELFGDGNVVISDVTHDSRQAREGSLFAAIKGETADGHRFVPDVMRRGAAGVISEYDPSADFTGVWLKVKEARHALAVAASRVNGDPSHQLDLVGITGTNGKTTTTYLCFALAEAAGQHPAMLTTVEYRIGERSEEAVRTTPEASDTNRFLSRAVDAGCTMAAMEASSQAIDLHRCDGLRFKVAVFTNLTRDHLDYHHTMENYFDAKKRLFDGRLGEKPGSSVINIDDEWGRKLAADLIKAGEPVVTTSLADGETPLLDKEGWPEAGVVEIAALSATNIDVSLIRGTSFTLRTPQGERQITSPLVGKPHVYNMLTATGVALELGYSLDAIEKGLSKCVGAPGRFERVPHEDDFAVVVDYAHTDDALLNTLRTARELTTGRIITVFGCGGDRDRSKRAPMGSIASQYSDLVVVTSDNPRNEDPLKIIQEIEVGLKESDAPYTVVPDRREAITRAIQLAQPNDVVIIAGKGHETYQIVGGNKYHFDDREVASDALTAKAANA